MPGDARALGVMRRTLAHVLGDAPAPDITGVATAPTAGYDPASVAGGADSLRARIYACYGWTQAHLVVAGDTVDPATVLGGVGQTETGPAASQFLAPGAGVAQHERR
jgi:hypothetical protein